MKRSQKILSVLVGLAVTGASAGAILVPVAMAQTGGDSVRSEPVAAPLPTMAFADMADLADAASLVVVVEVKKAVAVDPERTGPVRPGWTRAYVEAETKSLLAGSSAIGGKVKYLADVKLDARGRMPKLKRKTMVVFAHPVPGKPSELRLVAPDAQVPLDYAGEARLRALLGEIVAVDAAPEVVGVRDALHTPGNLAGEGETQIFLKTTGDEPASIAVIRRPGQPVRWGLSLGELVDHDAESPAKESLAWYRLACGLPKQLPADAQIATDPALRNAAARDYALVIAQLGDCVRQRVF